MATPEEEKKLLEQQPAANPGAEAPAPATAVAPPMSYGGTYDNQIQDLYGQIADRPQFNYDVNSDSLFQQYKDQYVNNAKRSMKDTMGQASALTGGYGSSYGSAAGQQQYDKTMEGLTGIIPQLQQQAYGMYQDQGNALQNQYSMLTNLAATQQNTMSNNYNDLTKLISTTGYMPTAEELAAAGLSEDQAKAIKQSWIMANPLAAYNNGDLDPNGYRQITGQWPPGYTPPSAGGGGYYGGGDGTKTGQKNDLYQIALDNHGNNSVQAVRNEVANNPGTYTKDEYYNALKKYEKYIS